MGGLVLLVLVGVAGFFLFRGFTTPKTDQLRSVVEAPAPPASSTLASTPPPASSSTPPSTSTDASSSAAVSSGASDSGGDDIVTDAEARDVVKRFMEFRLAHNVAGSRTLCTKNMLKGENGSFVNDKYWAPDSYEITKTTPDLMYIHVTVMGMWPSGREPTIYSVWRDPASGKVLIDGMLDPENNPDLVTP